MTPSAPEMGQLPGTQSQGQQMLAGGSIPPPGPPMPPPPMTPSAGEAGPKAQLSKKIQTVNIAESLDKELLEKIGTEVYDGFIRDVNSKVDWDKQVDNFVKLAAQVVESKTHPWQGASNVKYPLLATAAMQFAARAYPSLIPADGKVVQFKVVGRDDQGLKAAKADKLAKHMNYQLLEDMPDWEEEMDRLLIQLPIVGCLFKKTFFDTLKKINASRLVGPKDLVVNYWATSLEAAYRKTEIIPMTANDLQAHVNAEEYIDYKEELPEPRAIPVFQTKTDVHGNVPPPISDGASPYIILEQHTFWDLDDDGYEEPYIITIEEQSRKVLRIVARFDSDGIITDASGKLICIEPVEFYTKFGFIPNPDGGFYDIGFGHLLGPLNESANTLINQLIDAGTLSNLQAGFIGKGLRLKLGEARFKPGEWKAVNATGDDIKKQIFPLPVQQPSEVLFKLLGMVVDSGRELASIAEIFTGKMPGQNTPATTTQATIEQGMKVFTAIYKRTYRSLTKEYRKVFRLNSLYEENFARAQAVLDEPIGPADYDRLSYDVCPTADPTAVSTTQKALKAQGLLEILPLGTLNVMEVTKRILEAQEQPNMQVLLQVPQPQPDPKAQAAQAKMQGDQQKMQMEMQGKAADQRMKAEENAMDLKMKQFEMMMDQKQREWEMKMDMAERQMDMQLKRMEMTQEADHARMSHTLDMTQSQEQHASDMRMIKEKESVKRKQAAMAGMEKSPSHKGSKGSK